MFSIALQVVGYVVCQIAAIYLDFSVLIFSFEKNHWAIHIYFLANKYFDEVGNKSDKP